MGAHSKVIDDVQKNVMDIAIGSLRACNTPMLKVEGLYWILDQSLRPAIVVGYGTNDPNEMSSIHHIIKFRVRQLPIFNVVSAMEEYAVKHTRVATVNVAIFDEKIPASDTIEARNYLQRQYIDYVLEVAQAFRARGYKVLSVDQFENEPIGKGKNTAKGAPKHKAAKITSKAKVVKKAKAAKSDKHVRFITEEEDDEDGPVRCLTPIRTQAIPSKELQTEGYSPERADSVMSEPNSECPLAVPSNFTYKETPEGLAPVVGPDTPIKSIEGYHDGLGTPTSIIDAASDTGCMLFEPC